MRQLNDQELRFADEYMIDYDAKNAAIRAGYSEATARNASAWINGPKPKKRHVRNEIDKRIAHLGRRCGVSAERIMRELAAIAFVNHEDVVSKADGGFIDGVQRTDMAAVAGYQFKDGKILERKVEFYDKLKALELLGKHMGMFTENIQIGGAVPVIMDDIGYGAEGEPEPGAEKKIGFAAEAAENGGKQAQ